MPDYSAAKKDPVANGVFGNVTICKRQRLTGYEDIVLSKEVENVDPTCRRPYQITFGFCLDCDLN